MALSPFSVRLNIREKRISDNMKEETLDPENWGELRALGHRMLDDMFDLHQNIRSYKINLFPPEETVNEIQSCLTEEGEGVEKVYQVFKDSILPHAIGNAVPKMWFHVSGTGSTYGMLADMLTSATNLGSERYGGGFIVHQHVINWVKELLDFPQTTSGILVYGGSEANFTGLAVARNTMAKVDMKKEGVQGIEHKMTLYGSKEMHGCIDRSVELLGLGNSNLRWIPTDDEYRIDINALQKSIRADRENGYLPFCIIGCAGTVNTGAFDDLNALADLCEKENLWFHIDGAFGSWIKLSKTHRHLADGLERADSLAVDLHKWMYMPYGIGCTLVKDPVAHYSTFVYGHEAEYLKTSMSLNEVKNNVGMKSLALSRHFRSLKAYMLLRAYGKEKYRKLVQQNIDQINYLAEQIRKEPKLEITAPMISNIVCFRYIPKGLDQSELNTFNKKILGELWKSDFGIISDTTIDGKYMLRACCVNHRSRREDFDYLLNEIKKIGAELEKEYQ